MRRCCEPDIVLTTNDVYVIWFSSDGARPPTFTMHPLTLSAGGCVSLFVVDVGAWCWTVVVIGLLCQLKKLVRDMW